MKKIITKLLIFSLVLSGLQQPLNVLASSHRGSEALIIKGKRYSEQELEDLLKESFIVEERFAAEAGGAVLFIPGVGQAVVTAAGVIILAGVTITAGHWAYGKIVNAYKEHTKNKRKSTYDKHTKPRPGRANEKKKQQPGWKPRKDRKGR